MVTYKEIFNKRGNLYNNAARMAPLARKKEHELKRYFDMEVTRDSAKLPWSLFYAVGTKPV